MTRKYYITTPIYYVNAHPHIGHAYTTLACDTIARRQRLLGAETFFLTGTDEHGQKIERAAQAAGKTPQQYADEISAEFRQLWKRMGISNDDFQPSAWWTRTGDSHQVIHELLGLINVWAGLPMQSALHSREAVAQNELQQGPKFVPVAAQKSTSDSDD